MPATPIVDFFFFFPPQVYRFPKPRSLSDQLAARQEREALASLHPDDYEASVYWAAVQRFFSELRKEGGTVQADACRDVQSRAEVRHTHMHIRDKYKQMLIRIPDKL